MSSLWEDFVHPATLKLKTTAQQVLMIQHISAHLGKANAPI